MINITNLNKTFGNKKVLENLNCNIQTGSIYGLIGANGAGKSTLLRIMNDVFRKDSGSVLIDGEEVEDNEKLKQRLAFLPDDLYLIQGYTLKDMAKFYEAMYEKFDMKYVEELAALLKDKGISVLIDTALDFISACGVCGERQECGRRGW